MSVLNFCFGALLGCIVTLAIQSRLEPNTGEVWSFEHDGRSYDLSVIQVNDGCVIVDQAGVPVTIPLDVFKFIAHP